MATGRSSWLPGLPEFVVNLFWGAKQTAKLGTENNFGDVKATTTATPLGDPTPLPTNFMDRLKIELIGYANTLSDHRKKIADIREKVMLSQEDLDRTDNKIAENGPVFQSRAPLAASIKDIKDVIQSVEQQDEPLIMGLLDKIPEAKDTSSVVKLCDEAIVLIDQLNVGIVKVKGHLQDARDQKTTLRSIIEFLLALAKLPNLIPASIDERNDDKLYIAVQPATSEFFNWLDKVKVNLIKAENHAEDFLKQQLAKILEKNKAKTVTSQNLDPAPGVSGAKDSIEISSSAVLVQKSLSASPAATSISEHKSAVQAAVGEAVANNTLTKNADRVTSTPTSPPSPKRILHVSVPVRDYGGLNITPDEDSWGAEAGVLTQWPRSPFGLPGVFNHSSPMTPPCESRDRSGLELQSEEPGSTQTHGRGLGGGLV